MVAALLPATGLSVSGLWMVVVASILLLACCVVAGVPIVRGALRLLDDAQRADLRVDPPYVESSDGLGAVSTAAHSEMSSVDGDRL